MGPMMRVDLQTDLFPSSAQNERPEGFRLQESLLSRAEEEEAVARIQNLSLTPFAFHGFFGKRQTASFGWRYDFNGGGLLKGAPMPAFLLALRERAAEIAGRSANMFEQALVSEYGPGAGIGWHRDRPQFGIVAALSFAAACRLRFRRRTENGWARSAVSLQPRSAYVLDGPARRVWEHSIPAVEALRYSITFRTISRHA
jgi:alkylated DNA repair dioxygenase AlkB